MFLSRVTWCVWLYFLPLLVTQRRVFLALRLMDLLFLNSISGLNSCHILVYSFDFSSFNCPFVLHYLTSLCPFLPPKHPSYFLFCQLPFFLEPSIPPVQSVPVRLQVCCTFSNWEAPFIALLVWIYCFRTPCLPLCLHPHFAGVRRQITLKNR